MSGVTLVTGGARSGKSSYALARSEHYHKRAFIATCTPVDAEMKERIAKHRKERGESFLTIEEPVDLAGAVDSLPNDIEVAVIDCLTVWLGNLLHNRESNSESIPEIDAFLGVLRTPPCELTVVTNEVGMGIVPHNKLARRFRDIAGRLNQEIADLAQEVVLLVSGIPVVIRARQNEQN